jgi:pSer/pThr/pTyr-binding forkhead associated (FHA) protein
MKISLVVASGVHQGKVIAVPGAQFLIGRDEGCHLRPASPAVSKKHCLVFVKDGKAYVRDLGSTNGTFVNDAPVQGDREVVHGDRLRVGPLDFSISLTPGTKTDSTPLPDALKAVGPKSGSQQPAATQPIPSATAADDDPDKIAALLLSMGDDDAEVPGGSTIMDMPTAAGEGQEGQPTQPEAKSDEKKKGVPTAAETSAAASEILRRYMRRPR